MSALADAFAHCTRLARGHPENFPVGSHLVPRAMQPYVHSVYAFARGADDLADEAGVPARLAALDAWERQLDACLAGRADHPVFVALAETIRRFELPDRPLRDLLDAFRQDCRMRRWERWDDLLDYARRSANPVGRIVLHLFGHRDASVIAMSDRLCTALQLTNMWQDVAVDAARDRIYLPREDRERHGVSDADVIDGRLHAGFRRLLAELVARTRQGYLATRELPRAVGGRLGWELRLVRLGGSRILDRLVEGGYDVYGRRPSLTRWDLVWLAVAGRR